MNLRVDSGPHAGYCLDDFSGQALQLYKCVNSPNQNFRTDGSSSSILAQWGAMYGAHVGVDGTGQCNAYAPAYCPKYHPIRDGNVYDPSGPLLDNNGTWHTWEDDGAWSHWTSRDLIHWSGSFHNSTNFGGDTGSVTPTQSGVYAFWPIMNGEGKGAIGSAVAMDAALTQWNHRGPTIPKPARITTGYRDPTRGFQVNGTWYVGVGCGNNIIGAQFCLFEANDDTLMNFTDKGPMYSTNMTFGNVDGNIVWQPNNVSANMMECPDFFPLGDKYVLLGSLYKTNQWWVGTLAGNPPRFTPESVGILDYGNGYAAKTGSTFIQTGASRRLLFAFTGWSEPTTVPGCGRSLVLPRELSISNTRLVINPIPERAVLRIPSSEKPLGGSLATGTQVEITMFCSTQSNMLPSNGKTYVRVLQSPDGKSYTEIGYDFGTQKFYADHSNCCATANTIVQNAPLPMDVLTADGGLNMTVMVDGGTIEAYANGVVITPLVNPDSNINEADRISSFSPTSSPLACTGSSWQLKY
eukprot:m.62337 g.62337  ORF g.62337 m.62337 type:complete len:523 (-) comp11503_c0_seq1:37-1605(-)